jgi:hypothetical protein
MVPVTRDGDREGEVMECVHFLREEGEEARRLHSAGGGRHNEERPGRPKAAAGV